jgi:hypothetical protein
MAFRCGLKRVPTNPSRHTERPSDVRRSRTDLRARVNGDLPLEFTDVALTSYAGLELFGRYLRTTRFNAVIREAVTGLPAHGDFGAVVLVRVLIGLLIVGGRRLRHIGFLHDDPLVQRFCGVQVLPTARTVSRWLQGFTMTTVERLQADQHRWSSAACSPRWGSARGRSMWTASSCRRACRWSAPSAASIRITGRCRATTRSWRTWPRRRTCCA